MHKRDFQPLTARFLLGSQVHTGTISNLSEKGMILHTKAPLPLNDVLKILIVYNDKRLIVTAKISGAGEIDGSPCAVAVKILNPQRDYLKLVDWFRPVSNTGNMSLSGILRQTHNKSLL